jgi:glycerol uptake facilitator-like aquaporin
LVILLLVTVVSTLVILVGVKPDDDCFSFLCVKGEDGKCQVSNVRVVGLSVLIGLLVAGGVFGVNKFNPSLLAL